MQRIGIYGGSFQPPHIGHVRGAEYARQALGLDKLLVIPAAQNPHKPLDPAAPGPQQRLELARLAFSHIPGVEVSSLELDRGGLSYTVDTLQQLKKADPEAELVLLLGSDMLEGFPCWYQSEQICRLAKLAVIHRGGREETQRVQQLSSTLEQLGAQITVLPNPVTSISSTQLRRMLILGCADSYLPENVAEYIRENRLFETGQDLKKLPEPQLEAMVKKLLKPERVAHVLGCRDTAVALARRWGADPVAAARAGLLHDVTKALDGPLQLCFCQSYGVSLDEFSRENPKTLHALTGSLAAQRVFGEEKAVVEAIRTHTTGEPGMNTLQKIIYVADYMEPNRNFPGVEQLRHLAFTDLDGALRLGLEMTLQVLRQQGSEISPQSRQALNWLRQA